MLRVLVQTKVRSHKHTNQSARRSKDGDKVLGSLSRARLEG